MVRDRVQMVRDISGYKNPMKGKHLSFQARQALREKALTHERVAISTANLPKHKKGEGPMVGKSHTEETKDKIRMAHLGTKLTDEQKEEQARKRLLGPKRIVTEETREKLRSAHKGRDLSHTRTPEANERRSRALKGRVFTTEHKNRIGEATRGRIVSENTKRLISVKSKQNWQNPDYVKKQMRSRKALPSKLEVMFTKLLEDLFPGDWKYVGDGEVILGGLCPDWINVNGKKDIIELFGDYWHSEQIRGRTKTEEEKRRVDTYAGYGYRTLIIWEHELNDGACLIAKIKHFNEGHEPTVPIRGERYVYS